jgi:pSer/pThr/pTyr-binding forkhead associated (FHA) protein
VPDETVYKRGDKGREISRKVRAKSLKLRFKDRSININKMITIGRDERSDICIKDDPLISRHHALIEKEGEQYYIMDKGSTNGTYLNNNPLPKCERVRIANGDVITVGKTSLAIQ